MGVRFVWNGPEVKRRQREGRNKGLRLAAEHLLGASLPLVPHRDGILESSGTTTVDEQAGKAAVTFSGPYAVAQHERLDYNHPRKGQAKYLEAPMHVQQEIMLAIIATAIRRAMRG